MDGGRENHPPGSVRPLLADSRRVRVADRQRYRLAGAGIPGDAFVTLGMGKRLMIGLAQQWWTALDARLAMYSASPVRILTTYAHARIRDLI